MVTGSEFFTELEFYCFTWMCVLGKCFELFLRRGMRYSLLSNNVPF